MPTTERFALACIFAMAEEMMNKHLSTEDIQSQFGTYGLKAIDSVANWDKPTYKVCSK